MIASRVSQDGVRTGHNVAQLSIGALCLHHCLLWMFNCVNKSASREVSEFLVAH